MKSSANISIWYSRRLQQILMWNFSEFLRIYMEFEDSKEDSHKGIATKQQQAPPNQGGDCNPIILTFTPKR
jgi:hypothetical protein